MELNHNSSLYTVCNVHSDKCYQALTCSVTNWLWTIVPPLIIIFGTFGNFMTLVVLYRHGFSTTNLFFGALAANDLLVLYTGIFPDWVEISFNFSFKNWHWVTCKLYFFLSYSTGVFSAWLLVAMTIHRATSVVWPLRVKIVCTGRKAMMAVLGLAGLVLALYSHMLYGFDLKSFHNETSLECTAATETYNTFLGQVWSWVDLLSFSVLPFLLLVISNGVLLFKVRSSTTTATQTTAGLCQNALRKRRVSSLTVTLIAVSAVFFVLTLPVCIYQIVRFNVFVERYSTQREVHDVNAITHFLMFILWYTNSAVNFYIYCLTGTKFRNELKRIFSRHTKPSLQNGV